MTDKNMSDRTLLELAAKAANVDIEFSVFTDESFICFHSGGDCFNSEWNPLLDDGDALRLAVKLDLFWENMELFDMHFSHKREDKYAEMRRAIVRAAAEIGKTYNDKQEAL